MRLCQDMRRMVFYRFYWTCLIPAESIHFQYSNLSLSSAILDLLVQLVELYSTQNRISNLDAEMKERLVNFLSDILKSNESEDSPIAGLYLKRNLTIAAITLANIGLEDRAAILPVLMDDLSLMRAIIPLLNDEESSIKVNSAVHL
jgi:hypothetical protein